MIASCGKPTHTDDATGCLENELGLRQFLEERGHTLVVTADKEGEGSEFDQHLVDSDVVRSQPQLMALQSVTSTGSKHYQAYRSSQHPSTLATSLLRG